ncbi:MAG: hypothetical protein ACTHYK_14355 [Brevibacterium aurantiacum]|uniref:hypothetical protein n=1 Tax=Brevibacterium aurantiacum TaxID=273384 RepID=UPI003F903D10
MNQKRDPARNSPARIEAREKATQAVTLRTHGLSWAEVAQRAGYPTPDAARVAVNRTLDRVESDAVAELRAEEDAHLLLLRQAALPSALDGDPHSLAVLLRVSESRRKLHGADRPVTEVTVRREEEQLVQELVQEFNEMTEHTRQQAREDGLRQAREEMSRELGAP